MGMITATTTRTTRSTRITATTLLPLLAATCSSLALFSPPTRSCRVATPPHHCGFCAPSSPRRPLLSTITWIGARQQFTTMSLAMTDNDENDDLSAQENTLSLATNETTSSSALAAKEISPLPMQPKKLHSVTVCMVPPPENEHVWEQVSEMRRTLQDPGYYRWPPHANLLYPFLELGNYKKDPESRQTNLNVIVEKLQTAMRKCPPFWIQLKQFGTFGGKQRGVLWLDPESFPMNEDATGTIEESSKNGVAPLIQLQSLLEEAFPSCQAQSQKNSSGFVPHMTLSHFENLEAAKAAQELISPIPTQLEFVLDRIYLLERLGDDGQFLRVAEIGLGEESSSKVTAIFDPPSPFPGMPADEEDWVHEERMKLKSRRNGKGRKTRGKQQRRRRSWNPRVPDTPEMIAAKRAERKAKRERLEREQQQEEEQAATGEA
ncbi:unnamed protein product [Cylindrotheca closterium]|uniref:2'-5' RNA ligase n=1 Tax=Cylindrotheca closterium TaxID=2856 RepID=A0AAD2FD85_9STRA|nr:unnamed protein product [Cylindrotheca closterium]